MLRESKNFRLNIKQLILSKCTIGRLAANSTLVIFDKKEKIYIKPLYGDDAEEFRVGLTRENLLKLINDWEELLKKQPEEIILIRDENSNFIVQEHIK